MEGVVVLPAGLFFSGLFKRCSIAEARASRNTSCPWTFSPLSPPLCLSPPPSQKKKKKKKNSNPFSYKHDRTFRGRHAPGVLFSVAGPFSCDMWPFLCSIIILNESKESAVDLFVTRSSTICSRVAVRFISRSLHMESWLAGAFVGSGVWRAHHEILYSI